MCIVARRDVRHVRVVLCADGQVFSHPYLQSHVPVSNASCAGRRLAPGSVVTLHVLSQGRGSVPPVGLSEDDGIIVRTQEMSFLPTVSFNPILIRQLRLDNTTSMPAPASSSARSQKMRSAFMRAKSEAATIGAMGRSGRSGRRGGGGGGPLLSPLAHGKRAADVQLGSSSPPPSHHRGMGSTGSVDASGDASPPGPSLVAGPLRRRGRGAKNGEFIGSGDDSMSGAGSEFETLAYSHPWLKSVHLDRRRSTSVGSDGLSSDPESPPGSDVEELVRVLSCAAVCCRAPLRAVVCCRSSLRKRLRW